MNGGGPSQWYEHGFGPIATVGPGVEASGAGAARARCAQERRGKVELAILVAVFTEHLDDGKLAPTIEARAPDRTGSGVERALMPSFRSTMISRAPLSPGRA